MIPELGHLSVILALALSIAGAAFGLGGAHLGQARWMQAAVSATYGQLVFVALGFLVLVNAFVTDDFSVAYVAHNSNSLLPWQYKVSALWGAHEGSLLLLNSIHAATLGMVDRSVLGSTPRRVSPAGISGDVPETTFFVSMSMVFRTSADAVGVARNAAMTGVREDAPVRPSPGPAKCAGRTHGRSTVDDGPAPTTVRSIARRMGQSESQRAISGAINIQLSGNSRWSPT